MVQESNCSHTSLQTLTLPVMLKHNGRQVAITLCYEGPIRRFPLQREATGKHVFCILPLKAELVAADYGLRTDGLIALSLWRVLFPH